MDIFMLLIPIILLLVLLPFSTSNAIALEYMLPLNIDFSDKFYSRLDEQSKKIILDYAKQYPKIKQFYNNINIAATESSYRILSPKSLSSGSGQLELMRKVKYEIWSNDIINPLFTKPDTGIPLFEKIIRQDIYYYTWNEGQKKEPEPQIMVLYTPQYCYRLSRNNEYSAYYSLNKKKKSGVDGYQGFYFDRAPYSVDNYSLEYLFRLSESARNNKSVIPFQMYIEYAKTINKLDKEHIEIKTYIDRKSKNGESNPFNVFTFFRDSWVVSSIDSYYEDKKQFHWQHINCVYFGEKDGIPLLKSVEKTAGVFENNEPQKREIIMERTVWDISNIIPGPVSLSEFDVKQFMQGVPVVLKSFHFRKN